MKKGSGITFRRIPELNLPELIVWGKEIALRENKHYYSFVSNLASEVLRRISVGHLINMTEPSQKKIYILNCENCGSNKFITFDRHRYVYVLKCAKCHRSTFINQKIANDLKVVYNIRCPEPGCGADMIPRSKEGQRTLSFFGCSNYPSCKGIVRFRDIATQI